MLYPAIGPPPEDRRGGQYTLGGYLTVDPSDRAGGESQPHPGNRARPQPRPNPSPSQVGGRRPAVRGDLRVNAGHRPPGPDAGAIPGLTSLADGDRPDHPPVVVARLVADGQESARPNDRVGRLGG